jgi:hypothetical protein
MRHIPVPQQVRKENSEKRQRIRAIRPALHGFVRFVFYLFFFDRKLETRNRALRAVPFAVPILFSSTEMFG